MDRRTLSSGLLASTLLILARPSGAASDNRPCILMTITYDEAPGAPDLPFVLTAEQLRRLPRRSFATETIWTSGVQVFAGVPLFALLEHFAITGRELVLSAANDYRITIPIPEIGRLTPIIAYERNGKAMTARDYGPLWLVYDYDNDAANRTQTAFSRSIWQLDHITVKR